MSLISLPEWFTKNTGCFLKNDILLSADRQKKYIMDDGVWKSTTNSNSNKQLQTSNIFSYKWNQEKTYTSPALLKKTQEWLKNRYDHIYIYLKTIQDHPIFLDAGCGAAFSTLELFGDCFHQLNYIGVDISDAITIARRRIQEAGYDGIFLQENLMDLPFKPESIDIIFSEGVLHHTDSTKEAITKLTPLLRNGGLFLFYVYAKKSPIREFTDDYLREQLHKLSPKQAWDALKPLTELGIQLGEANMELNLPNGIELLGVPAGKIKLQEFFYWYILKAFYAKELDFDAMQHINFDWYAPQNAYRQTPDEVSQWCDELNLNILSMKTELSGITVIAKRQC